MNFNTQHQELGGGPHTAGRHIVFSGMTCSFPLRTATIKENWISTAARNKNWYFFSLNKQVSLKALILWLFESPWSVSQARPTFMFIWGGVGGQCKGTWERLLPLLRWTLPAIPNCSNCYGSRLLLFQPPLLIYILLSFSFHVCFLLCLVLMPPTKNKHQIVFYSCTAQSSPCHWLSQ